MKKRIMCIVLVLAMVVTFTACSKESEPDASTNKGSDVVADDTTTGDAPKFKIGYSYWSNVDVLGKQFYDNIKATVEGLGCEFMYLDWPSIDAEGIQEVTQNLIEAGCDGIIAISISPSMIELCDQNDVKLVQLCTSIEDESMIEQALSGEAYVGSVMADDYKAGFEMAQGLADAGSTKIAYVAQAAGTATQIDNRVRGIEAYVATNPSIEIVTNYRGADMADGVRQMLTAFPEIDGVAVTGNDGTVIGAIYADGMQDRVKIATVDLQEGNDQHIEEGVLVWVADGQAPLANLAVALLYNSLSGTPLITGDERTNPILGSNVYIKTVQDYNDFVELYQGEEQVYTADEIKELIVTFNPDATLDDLVALAATNGLESVKERHGLSSSK